MPRYNIKIVELRKIINDSPFDAIWHIWETDMTYNIVGSSSQIIVRSPDQLLSGCSASLMIGTTSSRLPIGTYNIDNNYKIVCATMGWILNITNNDEIININDEILIPNISESSIELVASMEVLVPYANPIRPVGYGVGASYSDLTRRI